MSWLCHHQSIHMASSFIRCQSRPNSVSGLCFDDDLHLVAVTNNFTSFSKYWGAQHRKATMQRNLSGQALQWKLLSWKINDKTYWQLLFSTFHNDDDGIMIYISERTWRRRWQRTSGVATAVFLAAELAKPTHAGTNIGHGKAVCRIFPY